MPLVLNKTTHYPEYVKSEVLSNPQTKDNYEPVDSHKFDMVDKEGKRFTVPGVSLQKAIDEGWQLESASHFAHAEKVKNLVKQGDSTLGVLADSLLSGATFGVKDTIQEYTDTPEEKEAQAIINKRHPIAHYGGYAAGLIGSTLATAGIGAEIGAGAEGLALSGAAKLGIGAAERGAAELGAGAAARVGADLAVQQATRTLGQKVIAGAANAAAQGVLYSTPQAIAQASYGDPERAAETLLAGAGIGAILGGGTALGSAALSGATKAIGKGVSSLLDNKSVIQKADQLGTDLLSAKVMDPDIAAKLGPDKVEKTLNILEKDGLLGKKWNATDFENMAKSASSKLDDIASKLPADETALSKSSVQFNTDTVRQQWLKDVQKLPDLTSPILEKEGNYAQKLADTLQHYGENLNYKDSKELLDSLIKSTPKSPGIEKDLHNALISYVSTEQDRAVSQAIKQLDLPPSTMADFLAQKDRLLTANQLLELGEPKGSSSVWTSMASKVISKPIVAGAAGVGHHVAGTIGAYIGYKAGHGIEHVIENFIANQGTAFAGKQLRAIARNPETAPFLGSILAKASVDSMTAAIDSIPQRLATPQAASIDPIKRFLGSRANGLSKDQQYKKVTDSISNAVADPKTTTEKIGSIAGHFPQTDDQNRAPLAAQITQKSFGALQYLDSKIPKNPNPNQPFQKKEWQPSKQQKQEFISILNTVQNPMSVIDHAAKGTLTKAEVEALKTVYPQIYTNFIEAITKLAYDPKAPNLSYQTKIKLSLITGVPMDRTLTMLPQYQMNYQQQQQPPASKVKLEAPEVETQVQRIANK